MFLYVCTSLMCSLRLPPTVNALSQIVHLWFLSPPVFSWCVSLKHLSTQKFCAFIVLFDNFTQILQLPQCRRLVGGHFSAPSLSPHPDLRKIVSLTNVRAIGWWRYPIYNKDKVIIYYTIYCKCLSEPKPKVLWGFQGVGKCSCVWLIRSHVAGSIWFFLSGIAVGMSQNVLVKEFFGKV